MVSKETAEKILKIYGEAWVEQDPEKILSIFAEDATYQENAWIPCFKGHKEIADYWTTKVCKEQSNIQFKILAYYVSVDTIIAEWDASFDSNVENSRIHIKEVAILETENGKIKSLREYWQSEKTNR